MKPFIIAAPLALVLASGVIAQTTATEDPADATVYGTDWSLSVGATFFSDADNKTLRSPEEIAQGWQSLSEDDRNKVIAECERFSAATNAGGNTDTLPATEQPTATELAATSETVSSGDVVSGTEVADTTTEIAAYGLNEMMVICPAIIDL